MKEKKKEKQDKDAAAKQVQQKIDNIKALANNIQSTNDAHKSTDIKYVLSLHENNQNVHTNIINNIQREFGIIPPGLQQFEQQMKKRQIHTNKTIQELKNIQNAMTSMESTTTPLIKNKRYFTDNLTKTLDYPNQPDDAKYLDDYERAFSMLNDYYDGLDRYHANKIPQMDRFYPEIPPNLTADQVAKLNQYSKMNQH